MLALAVIGLLAVASHADTAVRVPGTTLRFGLADSALSARGFAAAEPGTLQGRCRFFGLASRARLSFEDGRLARAQFDVDSASTYETAYVEDQLTAMGYRKRCTQSTPQILVCDWTARTNVHLEVSRTGLKATVAPAGPAGAAVPAPAPPAAARSTVPLVAPPPSRAPLPDTGPGVAAGSVPVLPETLAVPFAYRAGHYATAMLAGAARDPVYPAAALRAGIQGRVWVIALADTDGRVIEADVLHGVPELDEAALEAVRQWRFAPRLLRGLPCRFRVLAPVVFTLH